MVPQKVPQKVPQVPQICGTFHRSVELVIAEHRIMFHRFHRSVELFHRSVEPSVEPSVKLSVEPSVELSVEPAEPVELSVEPVELSVEPTGGGWMGRAYPNVKIHTRCPRTGAG